jgi:hypothetical protein
MGIGQFLLKSFKASYPKYREKAIMCQEIMTKPAVVCPRQDEYGVDNYSLSLEL